MQNNIWINDKNYEYLKLGDICYFKIGQDIGINSETVIYPIIANSPKIYGYSDASNCPACITISRIGDVGDISKYDTPIWLAIRVITLIVKCLTKVNQLYLYYYLKTLKSEFVKRANGAAQLNLSPINIENIAIPVPSLANQEKIVNILNKLNNLTTNFQ